MQRVLRGVPVGSERVFIGDGPTETPESPRLRRLHRPPPPLPPPAAEDEPPAHHAAAEPGRVPHRWDAPTTGAAPARSGPHPAEEEALEKLAEAERLLLDAQAEAERMLEAAQMEAEELRASALDELARAQGEAAEIRQTAVEEAERLRREAAEAGRAAGFAEGRSQGYDAGLARADEETAEGVAHITGLAQSAGVDRRELLRNAEAEVVRLAVQIARKVLVRELQLDPTSVNRVAEAALQHVAIDGVIKLRVNPADYQELSAYWQRNHGLAEADRAYEVVADETIARGGVVIDTRAGSIDARIETQLEEIGRRIFDEQIEPGPQAQRGVGPQAQRGVAPL
ncbi:MAG TPA: FliH/SctL family protein [Chloroflexota bacterium]|jgi:flagellar assembly protein FliH|nr:FliH/SctL family protein [Chloroflexota bacterium]